MRHLNLHVITVVVYPTFGSVTVKMIVAIVQMKETFVLKRLVPISNLHVQEQVIAFLNRGCVTEMMIASINK